MFSMFQTYSIIQNNNRAMKRLFIIIGIAITVGFLSLLLLSCMRERIPTSPIEVSYDGRALKINGERKILISGSIHYPRSTPEMWPDLIQKAKEGGCDVIDTYVFWNVHEPRKREYHFEGNLDLVRFIKEIQSAGLYAILRIGPYIDAEWNYGGLPAWLHQIPGIKMRTDNQIFKDEMQNFTTYIVNLVKKEKLFAPQGGPIILSQIENEYNMVMKTYGEAGKSYLKWSSKMAVSQNTGVPWTMCSQQNAPKSVINTCNGCYYHTFTSNDPNYPPIWAENWTGWFKTWDKADIHRMTEDLSYSVALFFQEGCALQNYYMYHGGTNFGRIAGPYMTTSYDYDAPINEYGNLRQPKWGHLKELHAAIKMMEKVLLYGDVTNTKLSNEVHATKYSSNGTEGCFLANTDTSCDATVSYEGNQYDVPAWSVSILPECKQEVYNSAKVTTQTSVMVKKPNLVENEREQLSWTWIPENMQDTLEGKGSFTENFLKEQLLVTGDASDYLWYMTSVNASEKDQMALRGNTTGHVLYAFVNGELIGSHYSHRGTYVFEHQITVNSGINIISLLTATIGLQNWGAYFDKRLTGIVGGPVQLIGSDNVAQDLSSNQWSYQIGLQGQDIGLYMDPTPQGFDWNTNDLATKKPFTWYKTTFRTPLGIDPVVLDLQGMGKGEAWVNGQSIGRYWGTSIATEGNCGWCVYHSLFDGNTSPCQTGCGQVAQRWYHVPRSFLKRGGATNTLVLFEEAGGDPSQVSFQTIAVGVACASVPEGKTMSLSCQGGNTISNIQFASFGNPQGSCGVIRDGAMQSLTFWKGNCESSNAFSMVKQACIGKSSCSIDASEAVLGTTNCGDQSGKKLAVVAIC